MLSNFRGKKQTDKKTIKTKAKTQPGVEQLLAYRIRNVLYCLFFATLKFEYPDLCKQLDYVFIPCNS